jgi:hypothetical protein
MHAITKLRRDIAFSRRRTQAGPSRNVGKSVQPTTGLAGRKRKVNEQTVAWKSQSHVQRDLFEERHKTELRLPEVVARS